MREGSEAEGLRGSSLDRFQAGSSVIQVASQDFGNIECKFDAFFIFILC